MLVFFVVCVCLRLGFVDVVVGGFGFVLNGLLLIRMKYMSLCYLNDFSLGLTCI